jgi:hypothetical protein
VRALVLYMQAGIDALGDNPCAIAMSRGRSSPSMARWKQKADPVGASEI